MPAVKKSGIITITTADLIAEIAHELAITLAEGSQLMDSESNRIMSRTEGLCCAAPEFGNEEIAPTVVRTDLLHHSRRHHPTTCDGPAG